MLRRSYGILYRRIPTHNGIFTKLPNMLLYPLKNTSHLHNMKNTSHLHNMNNFSHYSTLPSIDTNTPTEYYFELQNTFKNTSMSPKIKAKRLKVLLIHLINSLPNGEFPHKNLPFINSVINFIDQTPNPLDSFNSNEILLMLNSVLGAMTLTDVRYIDFFPRFYNALRNTNDYLNDESIRLQLFEIFINYILLSTNRDNVIKVINAFINEEIENHQNININEKVVEILIEAFSNEIKPDTATIILLMEIIQNLNNEKISNNLISLFFKAADEEISESFEDNLVNERLIKFINLMEQKKITNPFDSYVEILYFATKNNYNDVSNQLLEKLAKLTNQFTNDNYSKLIQNDILYALLSSSLKFQKSLYAQNLINILKSIDESQYVEYDWMSLIQYESYNLNENESPLELVKKFNEKLLSLDKDYEFADTDSYNLILESLIWSKKSFKFIEKFRKNFQDEFNVPIDSKSIALMINYLISINSNDSIEIAGNYFMKFKDNVDWENDYEGIYMITLFNLVANIWKHPKLDWSFKLEIYENVKRYEYLFNKDSIYLMMKSAIDQNEGVFAIKILLDQIPELKKDQPKLNVSKYQKIFDCIYDYLTTKSLDNELNKRVYKYLTDYFQIPYDYYPYFVKMFIDNNDPQMALIVFANMKKQSKELKLPPPNEEFYIYLLKSFSKFKDEDAIFKLHLAIKMDLSINLDIKLLNSLMEAYSSLDDPFKTRDVFNLSFSLPKEIGTNNESAYWMLKSLKFATLDHVNDFYNNLSTYEILPDSNLFAEYLIANCYFEQFRTAFDKLIIAEENGDHHLINEYVLKTLHNNCLHDGVRNELKEYCMEKFPVQWENLVKSGQLEDNKLDYPDLLANPYDKPHIDVKLISDK